MTIGIAILCDDGQSVVIASDRMLITNFGLENTFSARIHTDADCEKLQMVGGHSFWMFTGDAPDGRSVVETPGPRSAKTSGDLALKIGVAFEKFRRVGLEKQIGRYGTTVEALTAIAQSQSQLSEMAKELRDFNVPGYFVVAGLNATSASIFYVGESYVKEVPDPCFACIGVARPLAHAFLAAYPAVRKMNISLAAYLAYEAKCVAETSMGIGRKTQMGVATVGRGAKMLLDSEIDRLDEVYQRRKKLAPSDADAIAEIVTDFDRDQRSVISIAHEFSSELEQG